MKWVLFSALIVVVLLFLTGCSPWKKLDGDGMERTYRQISQEEAKKMMEKDDGHVILDVRRQDEYDAGHIPGAILIPNESIGTERPAELPDLGQIILIYCRSGNRSKQAAQKLFDMGYTNIYEFGGINTWTGETVTGSEPGTETAGPGTSAADGKTETAGLQQTETEKRNALRPVATLVMEVNGKIYYPQPEDNSSAKAFLEKLKEGRLDVSMHDYGGFEKVGPLPWNLPKNDERITTVPGDIILYQGNQITVYYDQNTWSFTRLARIGNVNGEELLAILGEGDVTVSFWLEWSE